MIYDGPKLVFNDKPFCLNNMPCGGFIKVEYLNTSFKPKQDIIQKAIEQDKK